MERIRATLLHGSRRRPVELGEACLKIGGIKVDVHLLAGECLLGIAPATILARLLQMERRAAWVVARQDAGTGL